MNSIRSPTPPDPMIYQRVKELEDAYLSLEKQLESLEVKHEEILCELGQIMVEKTAMENEAKKNGHYQRIFQRIFHSPSPEDKVDSNRNHKPVSDVRSNYPNDDQNSYENRTPSTLNSSDIIPSTETTSGYEGFSQSGKVQGTSNLPSTSRQSYENLSFSIQQDDSGTECPLLGNIPPTSVATTLYNNYKLLLLSLGQRLLSCEIVMLKDWAAQNFSIDNPQNAADVLFQLDQTRVINASDLSKLCDFFESIIRFDLVHIVDAFLLGDYSLLRQTPASKNRNANGAQNPRHGSTSRNVNTGQFSNYPAASDTLQASEGRNPTTSRKPENSGGAQNSVPQQAQQATFRNSSEERNANAQQIREPTATDFLSLGTPHPVVAGTLASGMPLENRPFEFD